ncbi:DUF5677 domain-containing protein [Staphylococcus aureus]|uniref:DUF5677 domain-containing protein n=1 Tax=Staphylococcus aureus TaxID=1280 RepID=UPI0018892896|nr:DUF5677 domain-containing protein [Staphylococcus aureus]MBF2706227.1 hypothetical protein [Staphylococcus aureus]MBF2722781.1 hypothetical protein [Staphylococcus aureus]MBU6092590.1 hypothetical protein [Staphylococcus aureus]MBU6935471.1 hypothetical protein [Staphylococcus aureus]MBU7224559.1 hypothetical protein [Staphylococcus aureus]
MNDEIKIKNLSQAIQYSEEFVYHQSIYINKHYQELKLDFNIQIPMNFFYSIIETTDGIYSLTYDKNIGSINALSRIQYESVIQFLTMLEGDFRLNILSYEYHQIKDIVDKNDYLLSVNKMFKQPYFKVEQEKWKNALKDEKFNVVKKQLPKKKRYTNWFNVTKGKPTSINSLIKNYFESTKLLNKKALEMYYSLLSENVHNHNVNRFMKDNLLLPIRRDNLNESSIELVTSFLMASLIRFVDFLENELNIETKNKEELTNLFISSIDRQ